MRAWPKNGSWSWACLQLSNSVCSRAFQINSQLPRVIKRQKGRSAQQRHLVRIFFFLNGNFVQEYWSCGDVHWEAVSVLRWISDRRTSGMLCLDCLTSTWLGAPKWHLWMCIYLIPSAVTKIACSKMLNICWASEKQSKISGLNIVSSDCLQAVKGINEEGKRVRKFESEGKS